MDILLIIIIDKKGIFQGDFLSPLPRLLQEASTGFQLNKEEGKLIIKLFNATDVKICGRGEGENDSLVQTVRAFSNDVGVDFCIIRCVVLVMIDER